MFLFVNSAWYLYGICFALMVFCFYMAIKSSKKQGAIQKFTAMAQGKTYDEVVAIMKKPQEEIEKVCPSTGHNIKVAKWNGGYYYWEQYKYDIVVVFDENGKFDNVQMY